MPISVCASAGESVPISGVPLSSSYAHAIEAQERVHLMSSNGMGFANGACTAPRLLHLLGALSPLWRLSWRCVAWRYLCATL